MPGPLLCVLLNFSRRRQGVLEEGVIPSEMSFSLFSCNGPANREAQKITAIHNRVRKINSFCRLLYFIVISVLSIEITIAEMGQISKKFILHLPEFLFHPHGRCRSPFRILHQGCLRGPSWSEADMVCIWSLWSHQT